MTKALAMLADNLTYEGSYKLENLGIKLGKLYTDKGYPLDLALGLLKLPLEHKVVVLHGACQWLIEHKRNSGAGENAIERQRKTNRKMQEDFVRSGETGIY